MLLFRSEEHARTWGEARGTPMGAFLTLDQQWRLASAWYGERLDPDYWWPSPREAKAMYERLGLTGPFWEREFFE